DEHDRHAAEIEKAIDAFAKAAPPEDQNDPEDANEKSKKASAAEAVKDLRSAIADEDTMHRAKSIACFRDFDPAEDKAFDKKPHLKALRGTHDEYETACMKAIDEFEEKCTKSVQGEPGERDDHTDWISGKMDDVQRAHKKNVTKLARAMCK